MVTISTETPTPTGSGAPVVAPEIPRKTKGDKAFCSRLAEIESIARTGTQEKAHKVFMELNTIYQGLSHTPDNARNKLVMGEGMQIVKLKEADFDNLAKTTVRCLASLQLNAEDASKLQQSMNAALDHLESNRVKRQFVEAKVEVKCQNEMASEKPDILAVNTHRIESLKQVESERITELQDIYKTKKKIAVALAVVAAVGITAAGVGLAVVSFGVMFGVVGLGLILLLVLSAMVGTTASALGLASPMVFYNLIRDSLAKETQQDLKESQAHQEKLNSVETTIKTEEFKAFMIANPLEKKDEESFFQYVDLYHKMQQMGKVQQLQDSNGTPETISAVIARYDEVKKAASDPSNPNSPVWLALDEMDQQARLVALRVAQDRVRVINTLRAEITDLQDKIFGDHLTF